MYFGRVIGSVVATHERGLAGNRLLLIERTDGSESLQREEVAVDTVQAGPGDRVVGQLSGGGDGVARAPSRSMPPSSASSTT